MLNGPNQVAVVKDFNLGQRTLHYILENYLKTGNVGDIKK